MLIKVVMELVDMNSLGLFDIKILSVQVGFTLYYFQSSGLFFFCHNPAH